MRPNSIDAQHDSSRGYSFLGILFVIFVILKLTPPVQTWSWWWVTSPLWLPIAAVLVIAIARAFR